uniref:Uncharacterized protein n=1 Tax=Romanomermis culicivorax TaxID=13658 RepID=A0A915JR17_ROMCU
VPSTTQRQKIITKFVKPESRKVPVGNDCDKPRYGWTKDELILSNDRCLDPSFCFPWKKNGFRDKKHCRGWCSTITVWVATCVKSVTRNIMEI